MLQRRSCRDRTRHRRSRRRPRPWLARPLSGRRGPFLRMRARWRKGRRHVTRLAWDLPKRFATDAADGGHIKTAHYRQSPGPRSDAHSRAAPCHLHLASVTSFSATGMNSVFSRAFPPFSSSRPRLTHYSAEEHDVRVRRELAGAYDRARPLREPLQLVVRNDLDAARADLWQRCEPALQPLVEDRGSALNLLRQDGALHLHLGEDRLEHVHEIGRAHV